MPRHVVINMKKSNVTYLPQMDIKVQLPYVIILFILFLVFRGPISYGLFILSIIGVSWAFFYENCIIFNVKSQANSFSSPRSLTMAIALFLFPIYLFIMWIACNEITIFYVMNYNLSAEYLLHSSYFTGFCLILSSVSIVIFFKTLHFLIFKDLKIKSNRRERKI
jgi:hypothetical protein